MLDLLLCHDCHLFHRLPEGAHQALASAHGFAERHPQHRLGWAPRIDAQPALPGLDWRGNADVKLAYQAEQTMTVTGLHSLASSATAGWQSAVVDNTANLFLDALVQIVLDFANTAPSSSKGVYAFAYHGLDATYTNPASGAEGAITLVDVTTTPQNLPRLGFIPYTTQDEIAESAVMSAAATAGGVLPPKWGVVLMNHSGAALHSSGNSVKYRGVFATVIG